MKILMLAPEPFFAPRGTPFSVLGRLRALSQLGHEVDLLTYHLGDDVSIPNVVIYRTPYIRLIRSVKIGPSLTKLFLDILLSTKAIRLLRKGRYDLLHTHEEASFFGVLLAKMFGIRHLYDMHSSLPQQLDNFQYTRFRPLIRLFQWLERHVIESSYAIITICPALEEHVKNINNRVPELMIENVAAEEGPAIPREENPDTFRARLSLNGRKVILYTGTFEAYQGIDLLIASAEYVLRRRSDVIFVLVGGADNQIHHYKSCVDKRGLAAYFQFTGTRPPEEIPEYIDFSHVLVSPRTNGSNTPLKIYPYLRGGKPIVATRIPSHTQVLSPEVAMLVEPNPTAFGEGILALLEDPVLAKRLGSQARQFFEDHYSFRNFVQKTEKILELALR